MRLINLFFICSIIFTQTNFREKIINYLSIIENSPIEISFQLEIKSNNFEKNDFWNIIIDSEDRYRIEMGPKILVSNNEYWKIFDNRTNQLIIQDIDTLFENSIKYFLDKNIFNNIVFSIIEDKMYSINLDNKIINIIDNDSSYNINFIDTDLSYYLTNFIVKRYLDENEYYILNQKDAFIIDIRSDSR